ncbi:MAG TPA: cytochrome c [Puia sp.]|jgi:mono/diheme cytochrome c family protein
MKRISPGMPLAIGLLILAVILMSQTTKPVQPRRTPMQASMQRGQQVYHDQCLTCHQADAGGVPDMNPPLTGTKYVLGDKTTLVQIVLKGMKGVQINDDDFHNVMAPHNDLTDRQIADVLTYVRNSFGNKARAISAAEVKAIRAKTKLN